MFLLMTIRALRGDCCTAAEWIPSVHSVAVGQGRPTWVLPTSQEKMAGRATLSDELSQLLFLTWCGVWQKGKGKTILLTQRWNPVLYLLCLLLLPNRCLSYWKPVCLNFFFSIFIKTFHRATQSLVEPTLTPHQSYLTKQIIILDLPP